MTTTYRRCFLAPALAFAIAGTAYGVHRADAQTPPARDGFANVRTLSFDAETIRVTPVRTPGGVVRGTVVEASTAPANPSSGPPAAPATTNHVRDVVHSHVNELATCAANGATNGRVRGSVTLRMVIDPRGHVRDAAVPQSTMIWSVPRCLTDSARAWRFDPTPGGVTVVVVYPIVFTE